MEKEKKTARAASRNEKRRETLRRVKEVLITRLNLGMEAEHIDDDSPLFGMGLGLDSIDALELVVGIEEEFGVTIKEDNLEVFLSVNTLVDYILSSEQRVAADGATIVAVAGQTPWLPAYKALRTETLMYKARPAILSLDEQPGAFEFITWLTAGKDIVLEPRRAMHAALLDADGMIIDLVNILMFDEKFWFLPTPGDATGARWIEEQAAARGLIVTDVSDQFAQVVCEGPFSWKIVKPLAPFEVTGLSYLHFMRAEWEGAPLEIFRAGVTNEYGFRIFLPAGMEDRLAAFLSSAAGGVAVRLETDAALLTDCLEVASREVRFPRIGATVSAGASPIPNELRWMVDAKKGDFSGREAVVREMETHTHRIVAFVLAAPAGTDPVDGEVVLDDRTIGKTLFLQWSPLLGALFGYAELEKEFAFAGNDCYEIRRPDGARHPIRTCSTPIFLTRSARTQME
ncbi:MAG: hypothetical protein JXD23_10620 [Spirochaetales bacterium]|nr:hypothetical protein [Spirochaetales bacterium]